jgi:hypothetical protein
MVKQKTKYVILNSEWSTIYHSHWVDPNRMRSMRKWEWVQWFHPRSEVFWWFWNVFSGEDNAMLLVRNQWSPGKICFSLGVIVDLNDNQHFMKWNYHGWTITWKCFSVHSVVCLAKTNRLFCTPGNGREIWDSCQVLTEYFQKSLWNLSFPAESVSSNIFRKAGVKLQAVPSKGSG